MTDARGTRPTMKLKEALSHGLGDLSGSIAVDVGCGRGSATRVLADLGAMATGLDPNAEAIAEAQAAKGGPLYLVAPAEATGLDTASADVVLFSNSLHHVSDISAGLAEAKRIARPGGRIAVMEPEAHDPLFRVIRFVNDEEAVYADVQAAIATSVERGEVRIEKQLFWVDKYRVGTPEKMLAAMIAVDRRRSLAPEDRPAFEAAFAASREEDAEGAFFSCWQRLDVLRLL
ncbi:MAG: class I SAM-dependent methyltransferase [Pseudomonadota bacterium]